MLTIVVKTTIYLYMLISIPSSPTSSPKRTKLQVSQSEENLFQIWSKVYMEHASGIKVRMNVSFFFWLLPKYGDEKLKKTFQIITTKCGCSSLVIVQWINEFIVPIQSKCGYSSLVFVQWTNEFIVPIQSNLMNSFKIQ